MKLLELSQAQRDHLIWRLDHKTAMGLLTAIRIVDRMERGDLELVTLFQLAGRSEHSAKIHTRKVIDFRPGSNRKLRVSLSERLADTLLDLFEAALTDGHNYGPRLVGEFQLFRRSIGRARVHKQFEENQETGKYKEEWRLHALRSND